MKLAAMMALAFGGLALPPLPPFAQGRAQLGAPKRRNAQTGEPLEHRRSKAERAARKRARRQRGRKK